MISPGTRRGSLIQRAVRWCWCSVVEASPTHCVIRLRWWVPQAMTLMVRDLLAAEFTVTPDVSGRVLRVEVAR